MPVAHHIEGYVHSLRLSDAWIHLVLLPIFRNSLLYYSHVPGVAAAEISTTAGEAESALSPRCAERPIGPAYRATLSERN